MYHKIMNNGEVIGISGPDSEDINDENWIEITLEEYELLSKQMKEYEETTGDEQNGI